MCKNVKDYDKRLILNIERNLYIILKKRHVKDNRQVIPKGRNVNDEKYMKKFAYQLLQNASSTGYNLLVVNIKSKNPFHHELNVLHVQTDKNKEYTDKEKNKMWIYHT